MTGYGKLGVQSIPNSPTLTKAEHSKHQKK